MRSTTRVTRPRRSRGLHREHGSTGIPGPPLDRPVDVRQRVRNHGQLRHSPGQLLDDDPVASLVGQALEILVAERTESTIALQSELRRLRVLLFDRSFSRPEHDSFLNCFDKRDYVHNDHKVGQMLKTLIEKEVEWRDVCKCAYEQDSCASRCGVRHLL